MDCGDYKTFKANFSTEGVAKLRETVGDKLKDFMGGYTDETLVEYVIVLLRNGRHKEEAKNELNVFLGDDSDSFVSWLWEHLSSHLNLYVQNPVPREASKVRSVVAELPEKSEVLLDQRNRRKRDWKTATRDSIEQCSPRREDDECNGADEKDHRKRSASPYQKRGRSDEPNQRKREAAIQPAIDAPRRLLQFAVRDAVETCRQPEVPKRLRSVVSTDTDSPEMAEKTRKIQSVAQVSPAIATAHEHLQEVRKERQRVSVFDRIGRDVDSAMNNNIQGEEEMVSDVHGFLPPSTSECVGQDEDIMTFSRGNAAGNGVLRTPSFPRSSLQWKSSSYHIPNGAEDIFTQKKAEMIPTPSNNVKHAIDARSDARKSAPSLAATFAEKRPSEEADSSTIFVNNVNFSATKDSLSRHFNHVGEVVKVTILTDAATRQPIGSAYIEFKEKDAADNALSLDGSVFLSRKLKVVKKSLSQQEPAARFSRASGRFPRGSFPRRFGARGLLKHGGRSFQWKREEGQPNSGEMGGAALPPASSHRSLTYIRPESKSGDLGTAP